MTKLGNFKNPTQITFGAGAVNELSNIIFENKFENILIITDKGIKDAGLVACIERQLKEVKYHIYDKTQPNPTVQNCIEATEITKENNIDFVVAIGGGSSIDVAKAVCLLNNNTGDIIEYEGVDKFKNDILPLVAIPTTAGTASEVTHVTVITDEEREYKVTIGGIRLAPKWALLDPELTTSLPPHITAATGLDALVHAIESYTSKAATPISKTLAREAIRKISSNLRQAVYDGENLNARDNMLMGSLLAGLAFSNTRLGNCHALSHPISAVYGVPHGVANSVLIPFVMDYNAYAVPELFRDIAEDMGQNLEGLTLMEQARKAVVAVRELSKDISLPQDFSEYNVDEKQINKMSKDAFLSGNIAVNPRQTNIEDLKSLYKKAIGGEI